MKRDTCIQFAFKFAEYKVLGNDEIKAFLLAANDFKNEIKAIKLSKRKEGGDLRSYLFTDDSYCIYNMEGGYFKFRSPLKKTIC